MHRYTELAGADCVIISSTVPGLSSMGNKSRLAAQACLQEYTRKTSISIINCVQDLDRLIASRPDLVFLGMDFLPVHPELGMHDPDKIWIAEYLEKHGIAHTGSGSAAHALESDKQLAKLLVAGAGLKTAKFFVAFLGSELIESEVGLNYPLFVKPNNRGGGQGVDSQSIVYNFYELKTKVSRLALELQADALIEEYLDGREFSVAIIKQLSGENYSVMPIELIPPPDINGQKMLSKKVKSGDLEKALNITEPTLLKQISDLALGVFMALGACDYGRVDIRLDSYGVSHFLEANLIPSLIENYGSFPKACLLNLGMDWESMILYIARLGLNKKLTRAVPNMGELYTAAPALL